MTHWLTEPLVGDQITEEDRTTNDQPLPGGFVPDRALP